MGGDKKILVVDDNTDLRDLIALALELEGWQALLARNGQEALNILSQTEVDLVVTDYYMPILGGLEVKRHCDANAIKCIVMSTAKEELAGTFDCFWDKTEIKKLLEIIHSLCE